MRPVGDHLVLEQLHYANEVRDIAAVPAGDAEVIDAELSLAVQLIEQIASDTFDPSKYEDEVGQRMLEAVERKVADGTEITAPVEEETTAQVIDLMAALRASVSKSGEFGSEEAGDAASAASKRKSATGS